MVKKGNIAGEQQAFDDRIEERVAHGHVPDLRSAVPCDWFYNNVWRRPELADMVCGRMARFALSQMPKPKSRVLEVGSGPGYISLELARAGHRVTGLELSPACVRVARDVAANNKFTDGFGSLEYLEADYFCASLPSGGFDAICFFQTLHHFSDVNAAIEKAHDLLSDGGRIIVNEPSRDRITRSDAAIFACIRILLSIGGRWHEKLPVPEDRAGFEAVVAEMLGEFRDAHDADEPEQSAHDNSSYSAEMLSALRARFNELKLEPDYAFVPRMVGGVRAQSEDEALSIARCLRLMDDAMIECGALHGGGFFFAGRKGGAR